MMYVYDLSQEVYDHDLTSREMILRVMAHQAEEFIGEKVPQGDPSG